MLTNLTMLDNIIWHKEDTIPDAVRHAALQYSSQLPRPSTFSQPLWLTGQNLVQHKSSGERGKTNQNRISYRQLHFHC